MTDIQERFVAGKALAVSRIKDSEPEGSWFIDAVRLGFNSDTDQPFSFSVQTYTRTQSLFYTNPGGFGDPSAEEIADRLLNWIQSAIQRKALEADDPPKGEAPDPPNATLQDRIQARLMELRGERPSASG